MLVHRSESLTNLFHYFPQNVWDTDKKVIIFFRPCHTSFYVRCWQLSVSREVLLCMFTHAVHSCTNTHSQTQPDRKLCTYCFHRRHRLGRQQHPTPVLLPGKSHAWRSLVGCSPWGREELDKTEQLHFHALEKEMATHSSVLASKIPGMGEPGGLPYMGSHRVGHD